MGKQRQEVYVFLGHSIREIYNLHKPHDNIQAKGIMIELFNIIFVESPTGLSMILAFGLGAIIYTLLTDGIK